MTGLMTHTAPSDPMPFADFQRINRAAYRATIVWPGAVGEYLARELNAWSEWGHRIGGHGTVWRLVDAIETAERDRLAQVARDAFRGTASEVHR